MELTQAQRATFDQAIDTLRAHGTGSFRADLPKALELVAQMVGETGGITPLQGLVLGAAARRLDEIAKEIEDGPFPNPAISALAADLREFRHKEGG